MSEREVDAFLPLRAVEFQIVLSLSEGDKRGQRSFRTLGTAAKARQSLDWPLCSGRYAGWRPRASWSVPRPRASPKSVVVCYTSLAWEHESPRPRHGVYRA